MRNKVLPHHQGLPKISILTGVVSNLCLLDGVE